MKIKCLIIDDEPLAQRVLELYVLDVPSLELVRKCNNALEAIEILKEQKIDLIFLDINMPKLTGLEFLRSLKNPPQVIITTAYAEFAIQGYELDVADYLMKPFGFERFLKAVQKVLDVIKPRESFIPVKAAGDTQEDQYIFVKSSKKTYRISLNDILYIEALGDYVKIYTTDRMVISYHSMKSLENLLSPKQFPRIHKSYIVSLSKIELIEGNQVKLKDRYIPIGTNFKTEFEKLIRTI
ncbi:MAG: LytTR family DNA-binding domain-containing protein [Bacteroidetes bacterium]|nr:LytTR family DNA-binding domain-containing protein [Bacteroidota bacterium]